MVAKKGPPSALEGGEGSEQSFAESGTMSYSVRVHTEEHGLEVKYFTAKSGDEAAQKALAAEGYNRASIRGVTPASDPDANSLGTEANAKATEKLAVGDITELKD